MVCICACVYMKMNESAVLMVYLCTLPHFEDHLKISYFLEHIVKPEFQISIDRACSSKLFVVFFPFTIDVGTLVYLA